jgi:hypothetical protein
MRPAASPHPFLFPTEELLADMALVKKPQLEEAIWVQGSA